MLKTTVIAALAALTMNAAHAGRFVIQIGTFDDANAAQAWVKKLDAEGIPAYTEPGKATGLTSLRAGPFPDRADAEAALVKVRRLGLGGVNDDSASLAPSNKWQIEAAAQQTGKRWYRGFAGDGVNKCQGVGGRWNPKEDLVRNQWTLVGLLNAAKSGDDYVVFYGDHAYTTLVYSTSLDLCQRALDGYLEVKAKLGQP